jgi:Flp pilus assembly protein TadG
MVQMAGLCNRRSGWKRPRGGALAGTRFSNRLILFSAAIPARESNGIHVLAARRARPTMFNRSTFRRRAKLRGGTTIVETALVLPVFLLFVLGLIELGHAIMVKHVLSSACRQAARIGSTEGGSTAATRAKTLQVLGSAVDSDHVTVYVKNAGAFDASGSPDTSGTALEALPDIELTDAEPRQLFMVRAKVKYTDIAIVPNIPYLGSFLDDVTLEGQAFMRHE